MLRRGSPRYPRLIVLLMSSLLSTAGFARGSSNRSRWAWQLGGNLKSVASYQKLRQQGIFPRSQTYLAEQRLRLNSELTYACFRGEVATELSLINQTENTPSVALPERKSAWEARQFIIENPTTLLVNRLDRAFLQASLGTLDITVGKQVVPIGIGKIFNAISQTPRQPFIVVDPEFPVTEDAVTATWNGALALEARYLPKNPGQERDNFHLRAKGTKEGYDIALTTGRSDDKIFAGFEAAGNIGDSLLRGEIIGYDKQGRGLWQSLLGYDTVLSASLSGEVEIFYNGMEGVTHRSSPYRGYWYAGTHWTWNITPLLKAQLASTVNMNDPSALLQLWVTYSLTSNMDLSLGQFQNIGSGDTSEFGGKFPIAAGAELGLPDLTYLLWRWYF